MGIKYFLVLCLSCRSHTLYVVTLPMLLWPFGTFDSLKVIMISFLGETYFDIINMFLMTPDCFAVTHCHKWLLCLSNFLFNLG